MIVDRFADCILIDEKGRMLLQHRDMNTERYPGCWSLFGGGIEEQEYPFDAVQREAEEELGIELKGCVFYRKFTMPSPVREGLEETYVFTAPARHAAGELRKGLSEGDGLGYFYENEIADLNIGANDLSIIKDVFRERVPEYVA